MIKELVAIVGKSETSFQRANGYTRDDLDSGVVEAKRVTLLEQAIALRKACRYKLQVKGMCGIDYEQCIAGESTVDFAKRAREIFLREIAACGNHSLSLSMFKYDNDYESAIGTISYVLPLDAEALLRIHDGYSHVDSVEILDASHWLGEFFPGAWISDEPRTRLI